MQTLLFVEDEASLRALVGDALADSGFAVTLAADGRSALEQLDTKKFEIVISDVTMPGGFSGVELANQIREKYPDTRVILVSGHARAQLPAFPPGIEFLPKPYRFVQLIALLAEQPR